MRNKIKQKNRNKCFFFICVLLVSSNVSAKFLDNRIEIKSFDETSEATSAEEKTYIASDNSIQQLFFVISDEIKKPIIVSSEAAKKRVTGNFNLNKANELLSKIASRTGLIWYDDGSSIYVYSISEYKNSVVSLIYAPYDHLVSFLKSSGLYDSRFPLRSDGKSGSFYISGPPVYVELVTAAAKYIDSSHSKPDAGERTVRVIKLLNTFVNDRTYTQRDAPISIPGVATVLNKLLNTSSVRMVRDPASDRKIITDKANRDIFGETAGSQTVDFIPDFGESMAAVENNYGTSGGADTVNIVAFSDTNSLLVKGSARQVNFVEDLVHAIDIAKRQIQLSLWIIDVSKEDINELGVVWNGAAKLNNSGVTFNTSSLTPENSLNFLANVSALVKIGTAELISRPQILTQENVPALFDNNSSFYAKLVGERTTSLQKITYGTMISVLPRLADHEQEIEMILNIHDGASPSSAQGSLSEVDNLPMIINTQISTEARVPLGYSLLVGGYSRNQEEYHNSGIPVLREIPFIGKLFSYSYKNQKKMVRLFLIHPELLESGTTWEGRDAGDSIIGRIFDDKELTLKATVSMLRELINK